MRLRPVRADEASRLRALRLASLAADPQAFCATYAGDEAKPDEWWTGWARLSAAGIEQRTFVVVDEDDGWHGLALVRADEERPGEAVVNSMWVAPAARGKGAGKALCEACIAWAAERRFTAVNLDVIAGNDAARDLYEAAGFAAGAQRDERLAMRLPLTGRPR
jgi:ribosomal protein S18 acetylase RimI-like enzyme